MNNTKTCIKPTSGIIQESYTFVMDGEYCSGYNEYKVSVNEWWKTGDIKHTAKEVHTVNNIYYRHTKHNGWRKYNKFTKKFIENRYTGKTIIFVSGIQVDNSKTFNKVNLGSW